MKKISRKIVGMNIFIGTFTGAALVFSAAMAAPFQITQNVTGYDCSHTTLATSGAMNDPQCAVFAPTLEEVDGNNGRPIMKGVYDAVHASAFRVFFDGRWYTSGVDSELSVNANRWILDLSGLAPPLLPDDYTVHLEMTDLDGDPVLGSGAATIPPVPSPTIYPIEWVGGRPVISGTFDATNTAQLRVQIGGRWYVLGVDSQFTASGDTWRLDLTSLEPPMGTGSYDIEVEATTFAGQVLVDNTTDELTILPPTLINIISHPSNGPLVNTGQDIWWVALAGFSLISVGIYLLKHQHRKSGGVSV